MLRIKFTTDALSLRLAASFMIYVYFVQVTPLRLVKMSRMHVLSHREIVYLSRAIYLCPYLSLLSYICELKLSDSAVIGC